MKEGLKFEIVIKLTFIKQINANRELLKKYGLRLSQNKPLCQND